MILVQLAVIAIAAHCVAADVKNESFAEINETTKKKKSLGVIFRNAGKRAMKGGIPGAAAGAVQVSMLMWLRTTLNFQYKYGYTMREAFRHLYEEGGIGRLYKGISFAIFQQPLVRFGGAAVNEGMMAINESFDITSPFGVALMTSLASVTAGLWRLLIIPLDTCKTMLQVEGSKGFKLLMIRVRNGNIRYLYSGAYASALTTVVGHFPWFVIFNSLNHRLSVPTPPLMKLMRNALIGMIASAASDVSTNWLRVLKATKQSTIVQDGVSYVQIIRSIIASHGIRGFLFRGLSTRLLGNTVQSIIFTVVWRHLMQLNESRESSEGI